MNYGYPVIFLLVLLEDPIITITASFFASTGCLDVFILFLLMVFSDIAGGIIPDIWKKAW